MLSEISKKKLRVADMGCGEAALAQHFQKRKGIKVRSFDLAKVNEFVEVCDMASVPLEDESTDITIFCLSLMGTNFLSFLREACRYTKLKYEKAWRVG
jgi:ribosomal RNA-processing protein 8